MKRFPGIISVRGPVALTVCPGAHEHGATTTSPAKDSTQVTKADMPPAPAQKAGSPAKEPHASKPAAEPTKHATASITGEVVDAGCYLGHGERGRKHADCAKQCIAGGMPMCLLTSDGSVYLLTMNHENADPYNRLKTMAGRTVTVTGEVMMRGGMNAIGVASMRPTVSQARPTKHEAAKS